MKLYHTDDTTQQEPDAAVFAKQFMGSGRQFASAGLSGDGTYFATRSDESWGYGRAQRATQFKAFFNNNAKIVDYYTLRSKISAFSASHPNVDRTISGFSEAYGGGSGRASIYAAIFGYNVIRRGNYYAVLDRSAMTVSSTIKHRSSANTGNSSW